MKIGIGASTDLQATVERCKRLGVERVFISCASLPGISRKRVSSSRQSTGIQGEIRRQWHRSTKCYLLVC